MNFPQMARPTVQPVAPAAPDAGFGNPAVTAMLRQPQQLPGQQPAGFAVPGAQMTGNPDPRVSAPMGQPAPRQPMPLGAPGVSGFPGKPGLPGNVGKFGGGKGGAGGGKAGPAPAFRR